MEKLDSKNLILSASPCIERGRSEFFSVSDCGKKLVYRTINNIIVNNTEVYFLIIIKKFN